MEAVNLPLKDVKKNLDDRPRAGSNSSTISTKDDESASFSSASATSRISESTAGSSPAQIQQPAISLRKSLFADKQAQDQQAIPDESIHRSSHLSDSIQSYQMESQNKMMLTIFFREKILCTQVNALRYSDMLVRHGVPTLDVLERRLARDKDFLLDVGFDEYDAGEVVDYFVTAKNTNQNSTAAENRLKSCDSNVSMLSCDSAAIFGAAGEASPANVTAAEVARLYYDASQCGLPAAQEQLKEIAADGNLLAQGFLMRMFAVGQGSVPKDWNKAQAVAANVFPFLSELVVSPREKDQKLLMLGRYLMGVCYSEGLGVSKADEAEAVLWYRLSADHGYAAAQAYLGTCYYDGVGVAADQTEAVRWYKLAAEQGFASAQCNLGLCFEQGTGVAQNNIEAVRWYRAGANQGHGASRYNLAYCYEKGIGLEKNLPEALHLYTESAQRGDYSPAQYTLGSFYATGKWNGLVAKDPRKALLWFTKAAENGHQVGQFKLAGFYEAGVAEIGLEKNLETAVLWYRKSAREGHTPSKIKLVLLSQQLRALAGPSNPNNASFTSLESGGGNTAEKFDEMLNGLSGDHLCASPDNLSLASPREEGAPGLPSALSCESLFEGLEEDGLELISPGRALHELGLCYEQGKGVEPDFQSALHWYTASAESSAPSSSSSSAASASGEGEGPKAGTAESQFRLGLHSEFGQAGAEKDIIAALAWYRQAALHGHPVAQYKMGMAYEKGFANIERNESFAVQFYQKSAAQGFAPAQHQLGLCHFHGVGCLPKNLAEAVRLYQQSAEQGYPPAINSLGSCHFHGQGVGNKNVKLAVKLYKIAADSGYVVALTNLGHCYLHGLGVAAKNEILAFKLFKIAAKQGYALAQNHVGNCYFSGQGVEKSASLALGWYRLAASQDYAVAQYNVGYCLEKGLGERIQPDAAIEFYKMAALRGNRKALIAIKKFPKAAKHLGLGLGLGKEEKKKSQIQKIKESSKNNNNGSSSNSKKSMVAAIVGSSRRE